MTIDLDEKLTPAEIDAVFEAAGFRREGDFYISPHTGKKIIGINNLEEPATLKNIIQAILSYGFVMGSHYQNERNELMVRRALEEGTKAVDALDIKFPTPENIWWPTRWISK